MAMQPHVVDMLFSRSTYLKKLIEEANSQEDTKKLLQFCCWENPTFSHAVLYELLWQIAIAYTYELRPYLDLLLAVLLMEDSWQTLRIQKSLKGKALIATQKWTRGNRKSESPNSAILSF